MGVTRGTGLGDTNYSKYQACPKLIIKRMGDLGASPFLAPCFIDEGTGGCGMPMGGHCMACVLVRVAQHSCTAITVEQRPLYCCARLGSAPREDAVPSTSTRQRQRGAA